MYLNVNGHATYCYTAGHCFHQFSYQFSHRFSGSLNLGSADGRFANLSAYVYPRRE